MTETTKCVLSWDEPEGCASPRGWCHRDDHPDAPDHTCVGNYLSYEGCDPHAGNRGPNKEAIHWVAYYRFWHPTTRVPVDHRLGYGWVRTIEEAKEMIEDNVRAYFGLPRDGSPKGWANVEA